MGSAMNGAQAVIASLEAEGVDVLFGYPGAQAITIYDALYDSARLTHILARHEQGAVHEADGYARATGRPGVVLVTSGPGATNTVTGIATAYMDSVPLVVITAQVPLGVIGTDAFQEADIVGITMPVVKHSYLVRDAARIARTIRDAFHVATTGRPGPVLVDIPSDVLGAQVDFSWPDATNIPSYKPTVRPNARQVKQAASLIASARRPLIYAGGGIVSSGASAQLADLVHLLGAPCVCTLMGKGVLPQDDPLNLGLVGMHGSWHANRATAECDVLLALGVRFSDRVTGRIDRFAPHAKVVHIDIDPAEIDKRRFVDVPIVGDVKLAITALADELEKGAVIPDTSDWRADIAAWRASHPWERPALTSRYGAIAPEGLLERLGNLLDPQTSIVVTDVGQHQMWAAQHVRRDLPRTFLSSGGAGTMGFGLPAAIGAAIGRPDAQVVLITGDGSFQMCLQEMALATQRDIPLKVLLVNNGGLGMVRQWQDLFYGQRFCATDLPDVPDFALLAQAYGWSAACVSSPDEVPMALDSWLAQPGPALLEVRIPAQEKVFPMVAPGGALEDTIGGVALGDIQELIDDRQEGEAL